MIMIIIIIIRNYRRRLEQCRLFGSCNDVHDMKQLARDRRRQAEVRDLSTDYSVGQPTATEIRPRV